MSASQSIDLTDPAAVVDVMECTAAELERRGERLLKLSRDLLAQAAHHAALVSLPAERSLGSKGHVTEREAIDAAKALGEFDRSSYAQALGLSGSGAMRWLTKLIGREHPIIKRSSAGRYAYIDPNPVSQLRSMRATPTRAQKAKAIGQRLGVGGLEGTGRTADLQRGLPREVQKVVAQAVADGWTLARQGDGHMQLRRNGQTVGFAATPRNAGNAAIQLRQSLRSPRLTHKPSRNGA